MAERESGGGQSRQTRRGEDAEEVSTEASPETQERVEKLTDEVDSLLDEIDEVLEENAEEFIKGYVQKGGE